MSWPDEQIAELKLLYGEIQATEEGGCTFFLLKALPLPEGCNPASVDALLCPCPRDGYTSRLFFAQKIEVTQKLKEPLNWNGNDQRILEKNWFAYSWKIEAPSLRLAQMVVNHLAALRAIP